MFLVEKQMTVNKDTQMVPKSFLPAVRKKCSSDREKLLKFEAEGREWRICKFLRSLDYFIKTVKGQNNIFNLILEVSHI